MRGKLTGTLRNEEVDGEHDSQHSPLGVNGGLEVIRVCVAQLSEGQWGEDMGQDIPAGVLLLAFVCDQLQQGAQTHN